MVFYYCGISWLQLIERSNSRFQRWWQGEKWQEEKCDWRVTPEEKGDSWQGNYVEYRYYILFSMMGIIRNNRRIRRCDFSFCFCFFFFFLLYVVRWLFLYLFDSSLFLFGSSFLFVFRFLFVFSLLFYAQNLKNPPFFPRKKKHARLNYYLEKFEYINL